MICFYKLLKIRGNDDFAYGFEIFLSLDARGNALCVK